VTHPRLVDFPISSRKDPVFKIEAHHLVLFMFTESRVAHRLVSMPEFDPKPRSRTVTDGIKAITSRGMLRAVGMGDAEYRYVTLLRGRVA